MAVGDGDGGVTVQPYPIWVLPPKVFHGEVNGTGNCVAFRAPRILLVDHNIALEGLGDSYVREDPEKSEYYYRRLLAVQNPQMTSGTQGNKLAEVLIAQGGQANLEEAAVLLERWTEGPGDPFAVNHFKWNMAVIHLAEAIGDQEAARRAARRGLDLLGVGPQFPAHLSGQKCRGVHANDETVNWLQQIAE